jgi:hypothetical protein
VSRTRVMPRPLGCTLCGAELVVDGDPPGPRCSDAGRHERALSTTTYGQLLASGQPQLPLEETPVMDVEKLQERFEGWAIVDDWRPVVGYEGLYEVSSDGRIRRVGKAARRGKGRGGGVKLGRLRKLRINRDGYVTVQLWRDGRAKGFLVHVLVAAAFLGPCPNGQEVNHRDGIKANPSVDNLEYMTHPENVKHAYQTGLRKVRIDQMVAARRKPRSIVDCGCGCGSRPETPDRKGRDRRFLTGHNMRRAS